MAGSAPNHDVADLLGTYRLRRLIGRGASEVWEAADERDARIVALRLCPQSDSDELGRRVRLVASAMQGWEHPHVVRINQCRDVDGTVLIEMPLIDGPSLADMLTSAGAPTLPTALAIVDQVAAALDAVHAHGLVHCDVTPRRILVTHGDFAHLSGFGLAEPHVSGADRARDEFVAPERRTDGAVTARADVFALARVLLECVRASTQTSDAPPGLLEVIARGMSTDPEMRYASAGELSSAASATLDPGPLRPSRVLTPERALPFHDDVQFTVYRPRVVIPLQWTPLLAFAHLGEAPLGGDPRDDPLQQVQARAQAVLGDRIASFAHVTQDSTVGLPEESDLTFVLDIPGFDVKAPNRTFSWINAVHMEEFQLRAPIGTPDGTARGRLLVMHGSILLAEVRLAIRVSPDGPPVAEMDEMPTTATPFRKIFPSYSHTDAPIVMQFERYMESLGDRYLRDVYTLRAGEEWGPRLCELIREADVFQLFWSRNAMASRFVAEEWQYALSLHRPDFIRPTYWEQPMPTGPGLPPDDLGRLHFHPLGQTVATHGDPDESTTPPIAAGPTAPSTPDESRLDDPPPSSPRPTPTTAKETRSARRRWLPTGLAAAAVAAVVGVVGIQGVTGGVASSPPNAITTASNSEQYIFSSTNAIRTTGPLPSSDATRLIVLLLLTGYPASACEKLLPAVDEALATVECGRNAQPGWPITARFSLFPDASTTNRHLEASIGDHMVLLTCPGSGEPSPTDWKTKSTPGEVAGRLACGHSQDRARIVWTRASDGLLGDVQSSDLEALHSWWLMTFG